MKLNIPKSITIASLFLVASLCAQELELFSVNLWGPGRANQPGDTEYKRADWLRTLRIEDGQTSGVWETAEWTNLNAANIALNGTATINGSEGGTATFKIVNRRGQGAYRWTVLRDGTTDPTINQEYMTDGVATLLDGKLIGSEFDGAGGPVDPTRNAVIEVSDISFPVYDVILYFSMNYDQFDMGGAQNTGRGYINFNNMGLTEWFLPVGPAPTRLLPTSFTEIVNSGDTGNYIHYKNVSGSSFTARVYGHGFNHGGIAGFQILEVDAVVGGVDPDVSTVVASPVFVPADGDAESTVTVTLKDSNQIRLPGRLVTLETDGSAVIEPATPVETDSNGKAVFTVKSATSGAAVFTAKDVTDNPDIVITNTATVNFVGLADAGESRVAASPSSVVADGAVASTITVSVKDVNSFPAGGRTVSLAATSGPGTPDIVPASALTDADGVATFSVTSDTPGTVVFTATADSVPITETASVEFVDPATPFAFNVNFWTFIPAGSYSPEIENELVGPAGGLEARWNQYAANSSNGTLLDSTGVGTGVAFTTNFTEGRAASASNTPMLRSTLTDFGRGAARTFTITGLPPGALFDIWLASYRDGATIERTYGRWTANNPTVSSIVQFIDNRDGTNGTTFVEGYNYIVFASVVADGSGQISFAGKGMMPADGADGEYRLGLSGFQLAPAAGPPPPTETLVIDLGTSPAGTFIEGGTFIGSGPTNLPLPELPAGSILRKIEIDVKLESTDNGNDGNWASDLAVLLGTDPDFTLQITNGLTPFGADLSLGWTGGNGGPGTSLVDTKTMADWATVAPIDLATTPLRLGNAYIDPSFVAGQGGTWSGTITLTYDIEGSPYDVWSGGAPFDGDVNGDGVSNGLAFLLGATDPDANALGLLPAASDDGAGGLVLTFNLLNASARGSATASVQWSSDLGATDLWSTNTALVPETSSTVNGVIFVVTPGDPLNNVTATIPSSEAADGKLFGRLSGAEN